MAGKKIRRKERIDSEVIEEEDNENIDEETERSGYREEQEGETEEMGYQGYQEEGGDGYEDEEKARVLRELEEERQQKELEEERMQRQNSEEKLPSERVYSEQHSGIKSEEKLPTPGAHNNKSRMSTSSKKPLSTEVFLTCPQCHSPMALYCTNCRTETCLNCSLPLHENHSLKRIHDKMYTAYKSIPILAELNKEHGKMLSKCLEAAEEWETHLMQLETELEESTRDILEDLIKAIEDILRGDKVFSQISSPFKDIHLVVSEEISWVKAEIELSEMIGKELDSLHQTLDGNFFSESKPAIIRHEQLQKMCDEAKGKGVSIEASVEEISPQVGVAMQKMISLGPTGSLVEFVKEFIRPPGSKKTDAGRDGNSEDGRGNDENT